MSLRDRDDFSEKVAQLNYLLKLREEVRPEIDQKYITIDSIINRIEVLELNDLLSGHRVLTIGDADLTGLAIAIFGNPTEVVVADIDDRLSELYFEATMEYDLPVRFVYHDMRIKMIAILRKQYSLVLAEPPRTIPGISLFLSRALEILEPGSENRLAITIPPVDKLVKHFETELNDYAIDVSTHKKGVVEYEADYSHADFYILDVPDDVEPKYPDHHIQPLYEEEVIQENAEYKCVCRKSYYVGPTGDFTTIEELESNGCNSCDYYGRFAFKSDIQLK